MSIGLMLWENRKNSLLGVENRFFRFSLMKRHNLCMIEPIKHSASTIGKLNFT